MLTHQLAASSSYTPSPQQQVPMEQAELVTSKPLGFPTYRRSHLRSQTYFNLVRIFSCLPASSDNGSGEMGQEKQEKGFEFSEIVGSDFMDSKDSKKRIDEVHEIIEGVGDKGKEFGGNNMNLSDIDLMMGIEEVEESLETQLKDMSMQANNLNMQQSIMDELELAVNGAEGHFCDSDSIPLNLGLGEKQNRNNEVELMDYQVQHVEFQHSDVNRSGNASELQVQGQLNQLTPESSHPSLMVNKSTSTKRQTSESVISPLGERQKKEMELVNTVCSAMDSIPNTKEGEFKKEGQCCSKVTEATHLSLNQDMTNEALNACEDKRLLDSAILKDKHEMQNEENLEKLTCAKSASNSPDISIDKESIEEGEIIGDFGKDDNSFDMPSDDNSQKKIDANQGHGNSSSYEQRVDVSSKKKRGSGSEAAKAKRKEKKRKQRAKKNRELGGGKRLKLPLVQKPKTISYCRHYLLGRCLEGDKCNFSHDTVPSTKSKPCCHFARHSCMKGDDCPYDHQLSKYPCDNFVSNGFCSRGDACLFSHQLSTKEDIPLPSRVCKPELKSPFPPRDTSFSTPPNNRGSSSVQQNHLINSSGICSHINSKYKVTSTVQKQLKQLTPAPKGVSFVNAANSSLPSPSTPRQHMITPNKESPVQIGTCADKRASGTNQTLKEIPKKLPVIARKGINFLYFGKGSVCNFKSSLKFPQSVNFGLLDLASSSLNKDDYNKAIDGTKGSVPQTNIASNEIFDKSQSVAERIKSNFVGKALIDEATTYLQGSSYSHVDHSHCKSVQEAKKESDNSQTSVATSSVFLVSPFEHASNSGQRAILSTLAFAAEHESNIKMKDPAGASPV